MPNGQSLILPVKLKPGLLAAMVKKADMTVEQFIELL
jgi:hypothetical protein